MGAQEESTQQLKQSVESLALELVLQSNAGAEDWVQKLEQLALRARQTGAETAARTALELADAARRLHAQPEARACLEQGLARLQQALEAGGQAPPSIAQDPELMADFIVEAREHLSAIESTLLILEQDAQNLEAIHAAFRSFHTIKGLAGFLELNEVRDVAHEVETVLDRARQGELSITPAVIDVVLASTDYLAAWVDYLEQRPAAGPPENLLRPQTLLERIHHLLSGQPTAGAPTAAPPPPPHPAPAPAHSAERADSETPPQRASRQVEAKSLNRLVKVDTEKLDYLVDMVGELVIAQSLVRHDPDLHVEQRPRLARNLSQLARITDEIQRTAMSMRMIPIGGLFQKMARLVRDLTRKFGKQAQLETFGEDVELDRNIVEELGDPLMHMIRNAVDHGIEPAAERAAAGKPPTATIQLRASHQSGQILIQVADDGRGLNRRRILDKAVHNGLIAPDATLSDAEVWNLIFHPGFSTAEQLSDVSGRGVGMDVVKRHIQKLRGSIDIDSTPGQGTTFTLRLPLTLAIIDGLVVGVGEERFIVPIFSVREMLRPSPGMVSTVENRAEVVLVREQLLPVVRLYERFGIPPKTQHPEQSVFVIAEADGKPFCLMVDELIGKQEVVIKSLGPLFQHLAGIAGGAILGDGRVGLILDMKGVFDARRRV
jgi:two-component system chemotaxis sensor kinase CheA